MRSDLRKGYGLTAMDIAWHMRCHATALKQEWITPNVLLYAWESDLLTVTPEGHVCEIEIKCSLGDLKNDLKKPKHSQGMLMNGSFMTKPEGVMLTPNQVIEQVRQRKGEIRCRRPNYFAFAMPCAMYRSRGRLKIPSYAGIFTVDEQGRVFEERRPIQLHTERISQEDLLALARKMHHRYWNELRRVHHLDRSFPEDHMIDDQEIPVTADIIDLPRSSKIQELHLT